MKIVQIHNFYRQAGGEDIVVAEEKKMLIQNGHEVISYYENNNDIEQYSIIEKLNLFSHLHFNAKSYEKCLAFLTENKPDICHVHNTLHIISPAIFKACKATNTPVVQTLHNYRSICVNGMLTKNNVPCEACLGKSAYRAVKSKCYRNSYLQTFALARMIEKNKQNKLMQNDIDAFICFTTFAKNKFIEQGIPAHKLHIKPNFLNLTNSANDQKKPYLIFVGRLDETKGAHLLIELTKNVKIPIYVIGEGPLEKELKKHVGLNLLGKLPHEDTLKFISGSQALLQLSIVYEGMPLTIIEAFANYTPIVASNLGAMASMIHDDENGLLFEPNNANHIIEKLNLLLSDSELADRLATNGFQAYQNLYNATTNYKSLNAIYQSVMKT